MGKTMAGVAASLWLVVGAVGVAGAQPRPGVFEEAGRLVDSVTDQIRAFAAQIAEPGRPGLGGGGPMGRGGSTGPGGSPSPAERPLITMMLHHRTDLGLTDEQIERIVQGRELVREMQVTVPYLHEDASVHYDGEEFGLRAVSTAAGDDSGGGRSGGFEEAGG